MHVTIQNIITVPKFKLFDLEKFNTKTLQLEILEDSIFIFIILRYLCDVTPLLPFFKEFLD
jgi:hypothetical protein